MRRACSRGTLADVLVIAGYGLRESLRRKVFLIVLLLSCAFLGLYGIGVRRAFRDTRSFLGPDRLGLDSSVVAGATVLGLAMFATLFLGTVLAIFLTLGVVRGDAERGLLQPLVVRPVGRSTLLVARFLAAACVCAVYVALLFAAETVITGAIGGWWPDHAVLAGGQLAFAVAVIVALSVLGSVFLSATANGIAVFMIFGGGLVAGLLGQIGRATRLADAPLDRPLVVVGAPVRGALPGQPARDHVGDDRLCGFALELGPFGGSASGGAGVRLWAVGYLLLVGAAALLAFARSDLP